jgi:hypothetical protein
MIPVSGVYVESRKRPVESSVSISSEVSEHFWDTTTTTSQSATATDTAVLVPPQKKRPRLQYRDHVDSFQSDDSWRTESTATSALTATAMDQGGVTDSSGQWVLQRNRSKLSISSVQTEASDHDEETAVHSNRSPSIYATPISTPLSPQLVAAYNSDAESSQKSQQSEQLHQLQLQHYQGDGDGVQQEMESLTSRVEDWSLTNIRALRRSSGYEGSSEASIRRRQVRAAKRDVMRVLRGSNTSVSSSFMTSCSNME